MQIGALGERMDKNFDEIKVILHDFDGRIRGLETREAGCNPIITQRVNAAWHKIDSHDLKLVELEKIVNELAQAAKRQDAFMRWMSGILATIIAAGLIFYIGRTIYLIAIHP